MQMKCNEIFWEQSTDVFCFGFHFMSSKWTRTILGVIEITLILQAYSCLPFVHAAYGFLGIGPQVLIAFSLVLIVYGKGNPFHHVLICIFLI